MKKSKRFQIAAILDGVSPLKDGGLSVRFHTNEASDEDKLTILGYYQAFGWLLFQDNEFQDEDVKFLEDIRRDTGGKSPSQRMRSVLFLLYKQSGQSIPFEVYYANQMDIIIEQLKDKLN